MPRQRLLLSGPGAMSGSAGSIGSARSGPRRRVGILQLFPPGSRPVPRSRDCNRTRAFFPPAAPPLVQNVWMEVRAPPTPVTSPSPSSVAPVCVSRPAVASERGALQQVVVDLGMESALLVLLSCSFFAASVAVGHSNTECYTVNGEDYRGRQNVTSPYGGKPCLFWNETFQHPYNTIKYPSGEGGLGSHNFCRNPDGDVRPWCYIADQEDGTYWKFCEIPTCQMPGILGCFKDNGDPPPLSKSYQTSQKLTVQSCITLCRNQKYKLAGMEAGYACFCGNDLDYHLHGDAPSLECSHGCFGDQQQPCGGDGHVIVFNTKVGACGGNYTSESAVIYSPDFPDKYSPGRACYWTIQVPGASVILLNFTYFSIMDQADMVELLDGYSSQVVARFDGRNPPREVVNVSGDFVILYFYSDRVNQAHGFSMIYQAYRRQSGRAPGDGGSDPGDDDDEAASTTEPRSGGVTESSNTSKDDKSSQILYLITSSPKDSEHEMPGQWLGRGRTAAHSTMWTIYALAALLTLTVIAMVAKLLLHVTVKSPTAPPLSSSASDSCSQSSEPWIIFYRPSTISLFKKKLKNHHGDLSPLVGN
ncbi:kremen protein 1 [Trichomycterus rosablanca]|uniref:kremen protein 1 n=1 Tax=Trichomycterus rosablanca TaxID=2290929 RepID=UPI002F35250C